MMESSQQVGLHESDKEIYKDVSPLELTVKELFEGSSTPTLVVIPQQSLERPPSPLTCPLTVSDGGGCYPSENCRSSTAGRSVWGTNIKSSSTTAIETGGLEHPSSYSLSSASCSSDEDSSRESVDLEEERQQRIMIADQLATDALTANSIQPVLQNGNHDDSTQLNIQRHDGFLPTALPFLRQRSSTDTTQDDFFLADLTNNHGIRDTSNVGRSSSTLNSFSRRNNSSRVISAHARRNLVILFLVAVYTTFGLTTPSIPAAEDLIFTDTMVPVVDVIELVDTTKVSLQTSNTHTSLSDDIGLREDTKKEAPAQLKSKARSKLSFARRSNRQMLTFRRKELNDFYHQKALQDETSNLSWYYYVNCSVLVAIALWAWRERSGAAAATTSAMSNADHLQHRVSLLS